MKTSREAAEFLGITPRRVNALIQGGRLEAEKVGSIWLINEESIEEYASSVNKKGGRPKRGSKPQESRFMLKNRTHDVAELVYDDELRAFTHLGEILDGERAPFALMSPHKQTAKKPSLSAFNAWWQGRGIPGQRPHITQILSELNMQIPFELSVKNLGFSLSDQYWLCPQESDLTWQGLNFFNNDFEDIWLGQEGEAGESQKGFVRHPDNTSEGVLPKHWVILQGERRLLKGGIHNDQEPYNEVVATSLYKRLLNSGDFIEYGLDSLEAHPVSSCSLFLSDEEEYIPALYVERTRKQAAHHNSYQHYVECCALLGLFDIEEFLAKMIVCDDILANTDRHWRNFGIIRNVETHVYRLAPLFDSGTSLWCDKSSYDLKRGSFGFESKPFNPNPSKQLMLAKDLDWIEPGAFDGFIEEAYSILSQNEKLKDRLVSIRKGLTQRVQRISAIKKHL